MGDEARGGAVQGVAAEVERGLEGGLKAASGVVEAEGGLFEEVAGGRGLETVIEDFKAGAAAFEGGGGEVAEGVGATSEAVSLFNEGARDELGGGGRGLGAAVGGEVAEGEVGFVADGGDDGDGRGGDGADEVFVIEAPQVFKAATTAADDEEVENFQARGDGELGEDFGDGLAALDLGGEDDEAAPPVAPAEDADEVAHGGAGGGSDEANGARARRERTLALGGEEALGGEAGFEFFKFELEAAQAVLEDEADDELVGTARLVNGNLAEGEELEAIAHVEPGAKGVGPEEDAGELAAGVLEGEVEVAAGLAAEIGDLAAYPDFGYRGFEQVLDPAGELGDGEDAGGVRLGDGGHREEERRRPGGGLHTWF